MDPATIITLCVAVVALISLIVAYSQYRENHSDRAGSQLNRTIREIAAEEDKILKADITTNSARIGRVEDRFDRVEELLKDNTSQLRAFSDNMSRMGVKVDMYWTSLEALAMNSAKNLHQPDPRRARVDHLLEAFMEGTLTTEERIELRKALVQIRNYEPTGTAALEFPVHPGEQTAAAILLSTMDLVDPTRMAALGHAEHRSTAHTSSPDPGD